MVWNHSTVKVEGGKKSAGVSRGFESAPRSIVQTGDILSTERNATRVLFCESGGQRKDATDD